jgi:hypothetical protein
MLKRRQFFVQICLNRHIPRNKRRPFDPDFSGIFENLSFLLALTRVKKNALKKPVATDSYWPRVCKNVRLGFLSSTLGDRAHVSQTDQGHDAFKNS